MVPNTYYENAVTYPSKSRPQQELRFVVDSRERNKFLFPNPSSYDINIVQDINRVSRVRVIATMFPFSSYIVNTNCNVLLVAYNDAVLTVMVDTGDYTASELAAELTKVLNAATGSTNFLVEYVAKKDNFAFRSKVPFGFVFVGKEYTDNASNNKNMEYPPRSMGRLLGFGITNYRSVAITQNDAFVNVITSEFRKNFTTHEDIVVNVEAIPLNVGNSTPILDSFLILSKHHNMNLVNAKEFAIKTFNPPLGKLHKLKVKVTDCDGNYYDFQNQDHRIEMILECDA